MIAVIASVFKFKFKSPMALTTGDYSFRFCLAHFDSKVSLKVDSLDIKQSPTSGSFSLE